MKWQNITRKELFEKEVRLSLIHIYPGAMKSAAQKETAVKTSGAADASTSWGLSFQDEGKPPVGNASSEELAEYNAYYCGNPNQKVLYLTFDAGYENGYTPEILDVLKKEKVPAAFFVVGTYIEENPELIRRMAKEGHLVGNHTCLLYTSRCV